MQTFKEKIEKCTTEKQVQKILSEYNLSIVKDDSDEIGCFSIWIDGFTRIYKPCNRKNMQLQKWSKAKFEYSGIPVFFG